ncbi:hypothetical protein GCM10010261_18320 [Streptomyces pilosus]|nr:hypothetical protein GCM10010261_18320 [Streptomyces pilosus]
MRIPLGGRAGPVSGRSPRGAGVFGQGGATRWRAWSPAVTDAANGGSGACGDPGGTGRGAIGAGAEVSCAVERSWRRAELSCAVERSWRRAELFRAVERSWRRAELFRAVEQGR